MTNSRFLLMTIFSMLSANSFTSQGHLIAKKKIAAEETSLPVQRFFLFGKRWFFLLKLVADNMVHGENLIAAKMNPDLTVCHIYFIKNYLTFEMLTLLYCEVCRSYSRLKSRMGGLSTQRDKMIKLMAKNLQLSQFLG